MPLRVSALQVLRLVLLKRRGIGERLEVGGVLALWVLSVLLGKLRVQAGTGESSLGSLRHVGVGGGYCSCDRCGLDVLVLASVADDEPEYQEDDEANGCDTADDTADDGTYRSRTAGASIAATSTAARSCRRRS